MSNRRKRIAGRHYGLETLEQRTLLSGTSALSTDLFPITDGATWHYNYKMAGKTVDATMTMHVNNGVATVDWGNTPSVFAMVGSYKVGEDGVYLLGQNFLGFDFNFDNTLFLPEQVSNSEKIKLGGTVNTGFGSADYTMNYSGSVKTGSWATLTVPAGTFNALKVTYAWTASGTISDIDTPYGNFGVKYGYTISNEMYLVQGLGMVKGALNVRMTANGHSAGVNVASFELKSFEKLPGAKADLTISNAAYTAGIYNPAKPFAVTVDQFNNGSASLQPTDPYTVKAVLSTDTIWGNDDDVDLSSVLNTSGLTVGKIQKLKLSGSPDLASLAPGNYYLGVQIDGEVEEFSASNNIWWSPTANVIVPATLGATVVGDGNAVETTGGAAAQTEIIRVSRASNEGSLPEITAGFSVSGSAVRGKDYLLQVNGQTITGNTVTIPQGQQSVDIVVVAVDDAQIEKAESFTLTLKPNAKLYNLDPAKSKVSVGLLDLPVPIIAVKATKPTATEKDAAAPKNQGVLTFTRSAANLASALTIQIQLSGAATAGVDYTLKNATGGAVSIVGGVASVTFEAGSATALLYLAATDDALNDDLETVIATIMMPGGNSPTYRPAEKSASASVTIQDDDTAPDSLAGSTLSISGNSINDATSKKSAFNYKLFFGNNEFVSQSGSVVESGTYTLSKISGVSTTLVLKFASGLTYTVALNFSSATAGKLSGTASLSGATSTLGGTLSLAVTPTQLAPESLAGKAFELKPAATAAGAASGSYFANYAETNVKVTRNSANATYGYTYERYGNFGFITWNQGENAIVQLVIFGKTKSHSYVQAGSFADAAYWERGTLSSVAS